MNHRTILCAALLALAATVVSGCGDRSAQEAARAAAQTAADEKAAREYADGFDAAVAAENWTLAKAQGDVLFARFPDTQQAARIRPHYDDAKAKADALREAARVAALWSYQAENVKGGQQLSAAIYSQEPVDTDGGGAHPVRLIFRDHPDWGRSAYLVLEAGDFDCYGGCRLKVTADGKTHALPGSRPRTDEAIAMFIDDHKALWKLAKASKQLSIEFPTKGVGRKTVDFEVGGLDPARLPKWN